MGFNQRLSVVICQLVLVRHISLRYG